MLTPHLLGECWCGVVIGNGTFSAPDTECNVPCNGNSSQTCGGRARLNLYVANELQSLEPCGYVPPPQGSSTSSSVPTSSSSSTSVASSSSTTSDETSSTTTAATSDTPESTTTSYTLSSTTTVSTTSTTLSTSTTLTIITSQPPTTTPPQTTTSKPTSTTTTSICKETVTLPPTCEYKCGKWCSSPLPDWDSPTSCFPSHANCFLQISACFKQAGWPGALECFGFAEWCSSLSNYCKGSSKPGGICSKKDFWNHKPPSVPGGGPGTPPMTTVITVPCLPVSTGKPTGTTTTTTKPATSTKPVTTTTTSTQCPIPTSTSLCKPPKDNKPPVGGIPLPVVTCNDLRDSFNAGHPFKLYTDSDSSKCKAYSRSSFSSACLDACQEQYDDCVEVYAKGCKEGKYKEDGTSYAGAIVKCKEQYADCWVANWGVREERKCKVWGTGPW